MNAAQMPGMGDPETWGPIWHPNDPRQPEPDDEGGTLDLIAHLRGKIDDAELAYELGNDDKARRCLSEAFALLQDHAAG